MVARLPYPGQNLMALWVNSSIVVFIRFARIWSGADPQGREASLMVTEKAASLVEVIGFLGREIGTKPAEVSRKIIKLYAGKVAANRRRLSGA